jgi:hypothetical protein
MRALKLTPYLIAACARTYWPKGIFDRVKRLQGQILPDGQVGETYRRRLSSMILSSLELNYLGLNLLTGNQPPSAAI